MSNTNLQLFEAQMAAFGQMDVEGLLASFDASAVLQDMSAPESPWTGTEEIREFLTDYFAHLAKAQVNIAAVATSEGRVFAELEVRAEYLADTSFPSDVHEVLMRYCVVETFSLGKIVHERFYWDRAEFESQVRARMEPSAPTATAR